MQAEQQLTVADRLSSSLWAPWKGRESTHACWFNTNTGDGESCSSRMLSWSHCFGRDGPWAEQSNFACPGWKNKTPPSVQTNWSRTLSPPVTQSRRFLFLKLRRCALLIAAIKHLSVQSHNILQTATKNARAAGLNLQPLTLSLCYSFPLIPCVAHDPEITFTPVSCQAQEILFRPS